MPKIAITDYFTECSLEAEVLGKLVGIGPDSETEILLVWHEHINSHYLKNFPKVRGVQRYGVGYDTIDLDYLLSKGIICANNPDYGTDEVSDTAVAMILNIARNVFHYNNLAKTYFNNWQENINPHIKRNSDTTIGIIGAGRIGGSVVLKCKALKFDVVIFDPYKERGYEKMLGCRRVETLEELLVQSDIVSIHTPLNSETKGLIDEGFIQQMKKGASLVNTARGGLFNGLNLILKALENHRLFSVAIDVLEKEPPIDEPLIQAWRISRFDINGRLIINPHTSYYSQASYRELRINSATNALKMFLRQTVFNILNK